MLELWSEHSDNIAEPASPGGVLGGGSSPSRAFMENASRALFIGTQMMISWPEAYDSLLVSNSDLNIHSIISRVFEVLNTLCGCANTNANLSRYLGTRVFEVIYAWGSDDDITLTLLNKFNLLQALLIDGVFLPYRNHQQQQHQYTLEQITRVVVVASNALERVITHSTSTCEDNSVVQLVISHLLSRCKWQLEWCVQQGLPFNLIDIKL